MILGWAEGRDGDAAVELPNDVLDARPVIAPERNAFRLLVADGEVGDGGRWIGDGGELENAAESSEGCKS